MKEMSRRNGMNITVAELLFITLLLFFATIKSSQSDEIEAKNYETFLLKTIFKGYDKRARPVRNYHSPVVVGFKIELHQIIQIDEKHEVITLNILHAQHWQDEFLESRRLRKRYASMWENYFPERKRERGHAHFINVLWSFSCPFLVAKCGLQMCSCTMPLHSIRKNKWSIAGQKMSSSTMEWLPMYCQWLWNQHAR